MSQFIRIRGTINSQYSVKANDNGTEKLTLSLSLNDGSENDSHLIHLSYKEGLLNRMIEHNLLSIGHFIEIKDLILINKSDVVAGKVIDKSFYMLMPTANVFSSLEILVHSFSDYSKEKNESISIADELRKRKGFISASMNGFLISEPVINDNEVSFKVMVELYGYTDRVSHEWVSITEIYTVKATVTAKELQYLSDHSMGKGDKVSFSPPVSDNENTMTLVKSSRDSFFLITGEALRTASLLKKAFS
jgi:hypothetical protein